MSSPTHRPSRREAAATIGEFVDLVRARLRHLKETRGWTQEDVAQKAGMSQQRLSLFLNEQIRVTPEFVAALTTAADLDPKEAVRAFYRDLEKLTGHPYFTDPQLWEGIRERDIPDKP